MYIHWRYSCLESSVNGASQNADSHNYADVNGMRLHYASIGKGPLVLFLYGYPSFWYQWKDQMAEMGKDHLAVGLDMRGYHLSSRPESLEPYKIKHLVEDVRQFAEKIVGKDKKFTLVGEGDDRGCEVDHHQRADARDLGDEGRRDSVRPSQWSRQMGPEPQRQALSRR